MRGKLIEAKSFADGIRITPAHAGKTGMPANLHSQVTDHPRACGENMRVAMPPHGLKGSPPRMRGKLAQCAPETCENRITPAHAGKTTFAILPFTDSMDHPRACGENYVRENGRIRLPGSPPRMRGKHYLFILFYRDPGITPAHAGKTIIAVCR